MNLARKQWSCVVASIGLLCVHPVFGQSDSQNRTREIEKISSHSRAASSARISKTADFSNKPVVDGTWREDGRYIIINLNGQELRLLKSQPDRKSSRTSKRHERESAVKQVAGQREVIGAIVDGRMLVGRNPLVNCRVTLIPLRRSWDSFVANETAEKYSATTNSSGEYRFDSVVQGQYKLFWKPQGTLQWIRRLQFHPDVIVRDNKHVQVKTIRSALRTIN